MGDFHCAWCRARCGGVYTLFPRYQCTERKILIPWKLQVKAVHVIVGESQASAARDKHNQVFGGRNMEGFPQAIHTRFVPDVSDSCFPVTSSTRVKAIKMLAKQKTLLASTKQIHTDAIAFAFTFPMRR